MRKSSSSRSTVMVVEDDHDVRVSLRAILEGEGFIVHSAANGQAALELLLELAEKPGLIIVDLMMPVMDGWQFIGLVQGTPSLAHIPIIVQSAHCDHDPPAGVAAFIAEPIDVNRLLAIVGQHCG